jgi:hypothetical protein
MVKRTEKLHQFNKSKKAVANKIRKSGSGSAIKKSRASTNPYRPDPSGGKKGS